MIATTVSKVDNNPHNDLNFRAVGATMVAPLVESGLHCGCFQ